MRSKIISTLAPWALISLILAALLVVVPQMAGAAKQKTAQPVEIKSDIESTTLTRAAFPYQSNLTFKGQPATGLYDFEFKLYDQAVGGEQIGQTHTANRVNVDNGLFDAFLDFGQVPVETAYLEIRVRPGDSVDPFTSLAPRQTVAVAQFETAAGVSTDPKEPAVPPAAPAKSQSLQISPSAVSGEIWKLGFTTTDNNVYTYTVKGRALGEAVFRSDRNIFHNFHLYYIFPAPASTKTVESAKYYILDRSGSYPNIADMSLGVYSFDGTRQHVVSTTSTDLRTATTGIWTDVALSGTTANKEIEGASGEFLAVQVAFNGGSGGNLDVRLMFEVEVR